MNLTKNRVVGYLFAIFAVALSNLFIVGCVSTKSGPSVLIGNATEKQLENAVIKSGSENYSFDRIAAFNVSAPELRLSELAERVTVEWRCSDGQEGRSSVALGKDLRDYKGQIQFQVDAEGAVKVFTAPVESSSDSALPWSMPANWEGSPTIPGMNM